MVFIFANISRSWLHFLSVYNSMVWILIRPSASLFYVRNAIDCMVLDAVDQGIPGRPKIYFSFSKREPRLYSLTNGFPGKSLGQLTSG